MIAGQRGTLPQSNTSQEWQFVEGSIMQCAHRPLGRWKKIETKFFSVCIPPELKPRKVPSEDSTVWRYVSKEMELTIDLGHYSEQPPGDNEEPNYHEERLEIDGRKATLCFFGPTGSVPGNRQNYLAGAYFSEIGLKETKLAVVARYSTLDGQSKAQKIFSSIRFKTSRR